MILAWRTTMRSQQGISVSLAAVLLLGLAGILLTSISAAQGTSGTPSEPPAETLWHPPGPHAKSTPDARAPFPYAAARWHPIHFQPAINEATNAQCLSCHLEVVEKRVREATPAGVPTKDTLAWYQTLEVYEGEQETFHRRHMVTPMATELMNLQCTTCHQGNDPREEASGSAADTQEGLVLRKQVDPKVCLMCHGRFNHEVMNLPGPWHEHGEMFGNSCTGCHAALRTHRHQVNFLDADAIEAAGQRSADACYDCHGGRSWYRIAYPYPRNAWPGMPETVPEWASDRPTESQARFRNHPENTPSAGADAGSP
jgi:hypothetical protein